MEAKKALEMFSRGIDCSQVVFGEFAEDLGLDTLTAHQVAACFGGGMERGDTCGCVTGALMALGLKYGPQELGDTEGKAELSRIRAEFEERFAEEFGSIYCRELLGGSVADPREKAVIDAQGTILRRCPGFAEGACRILEDMLED